MHSVYVCLISEKILFYLKFNLKHNRKEKSHKNGIYWFLEKLKEHFLDCGKRGKVGQEIIFRAATFGRRTQIFQRSSNILKHLKYIEYFNKL